MRHPPALLVVLALLPASGPAVADQVALPPDPPPVLALAQRNTIDDWTSTLAIFTPDGARTVVLDDIPLSSQFLAVHAATGRWTMSFDQLSNGDPLVIAGKTVSKPGALNTLVFGDSTGVLATKYGDPACTDKKRACFETPLQFSADGAYVFVQSLTSSWASVSRWTFGKKPKRATIASKKAGGISISPDGKRAGYLAKDGYHVTVFPKQKKKAVKVKTTKQAVANPDLLMSEVWPIGDRLYWLRREPTEQKRGWYEAFDLTTKQTITLREASVEYPMMSGRFLSSGPRGTVLFGEDTSFERLDIYEVTGDTAAKVASDVRQLLDVSPDGRYLLVTRRKDPTQGETGTNPELLVIIDLETQQDVAVIDTIGAGNKIADAAFTKAP